MPVDNYGRVYDEFSLRRPGSGRWIRSQNQLRLCRRTTYAGGMGNAQRCMDAIDHADIAWLSSYAVWWDENRNSWSSNWEWVRPIRVKVHKRPLEVTECRSPGKKSRR